MLASAAVMTYETWWKCLKILQSYSFSRKHMLRESQRLQNQNTAERQASFLKGYKATTSPVLSSYKKLFTHSRPVIKEDLPLNYMFMFYRQKSSHVMAGLISNEEKHYLFFTEEWKTIKQYLYINLLRKKISVVSRVGR